MVAAAEDPVQSKLSLCHCKGVTALVTLSLQGIQSCRKLCLSIYLTDLKTVFRFTSIRRSDSVSKYLEEYSEKRMERRLEVMMIDDDDDNDDDYW